MPVRKTSPENLQSTPVAAQPSPAKEMVEALKARIRQKGLDRLDEVEREYESAKNIYSCLSWWPEVARFSEEVLSTARREIKEASLAREERERQHQLELERIKAQMPNITLIQQPNAVTGVDAGGIDQQVLAFGQTPTITHTTTT